jgi:hypothetical protein
MPPKKDKENMVDFNKRLHSEKNYPKAMANLKKRLKKSFKTANQKLIYNEICLLFDHDNLTSTPILKKDLSKFLEVISKNARLKYHPFDIVQYNNDVVISNDILTSTSDQLIQAVLRKSVYLSNHLTYNGFLDKRKNEPSKFYYQNNLILSWDLEPGNGNYKCDFFIDDSRRLMIDVREGQLKDVKLMIKGGKIGEEKRILLTEFYNGTWMVRNEKLKELMRTFIGPYFKECEFRG